MGGGGLDELVDRTLSLSIGGGLKFSLPAPVASGRLGRSEMPTTLDLNTLDTTYQFDFSASDFCLLVSEVH
jgi:hypothetical protein